MNLPDRGMADEVGCLSGNHSFSDLTDYQTRCDQQNRNFPAVTGSARFRFSCGKLTANLG